MKNKYNEAIIKIISVDREDIVTESTGAIQPTSGEHVFGDNWD